MRKLWRSKSSNYAFPLLSVLFLIISVLLFPTENVLYLIAISIASTSFFFLCLYVSVKSFQRTSALEKSVNEYLYKKDFTQEIERFTPIFSNDSSEFRGIVIDEMIYLVRRRENAYAVEIIPHASGITFYLFHYLKEDPGQDFIVIHNLYSDEISAFQHLV